MHSSSSSAAPKMLLFVLLSDDHWKGTPSKRDKKKKKRFWLHDKEEFRPLSAAPLTSQKSGAQDLVTNSFNRTSESRLRPEVV